MRELRHVVWVSEGASPDGGAARYVWETARELKLRGVRSTLLYDPGSPAPAELLEIFDGAFPLLEPARQISELAPDVVYAHRLPSGVSEEALAAAGRPVVRFFHDHQLFCLREHKYRTLGLSPCSEAVGMRCYACLGFVAKTPELPRFRLRTVGALRARQRANLAFSSFVVGSQAMARQLDLHGFPAARVHVVPLYAPQPATDVVATRGKRLLYIGALTRGKGLDVLLRALARVSPAVALDVVGRGPQEDEWRALSSSLGLDERVAFLGPRHASALASLYREALAVVVPSRAPETFGLVGVEAMSHGTPTIASVAGGIEEWLEDGVTGVGVVPGDDVALARAITGLASDADAARAMGDAGRRAHRAKFLPEHHVAALLPVLDAAARGAA